MALLAAGARILDRLFCNAVAMAVSIWSLDAIDLQQYLARFPLSPEQIERPGERGAALRIRWQQIGVIAAYRQPSIPHGQSH